MSQKPKPQNRSISSYFKPTSHKPASPSPSPSPARPTARQPQREPEPSSPASRLTSLPPSTPPRPSFSSPSALLNTPTPKPKRPDEIDASDDEGSEASSSLEDFNFNFSIPPPAPSPVKITVPARQIYGFKILAEDSKREEAISASSKRLPAVAADAADHPHPSGVDPATSLGGVIGDVVRADSDGRGAGRGGDADADAKKVLRTVQRTDHATAQTCYCFFDRSYRAPPAPPPPQLRGAASPWRLLTQGNSAVRERNLASGMPQTILAMRGGLPDDVFRWILDELCVCRSSLARQEYCNIIAGCSEQVRRLLTPERLRGMFLRLGASGELEDLEAPLTVSRPSHMPYQDRDWSCVISFLSLLDAVAESLSTPSAIYAIRVLLRMALDKVIICSVDLHTAWDDAINHLISAIPQSSWDSFCHETCSLLHANIKSQFIRTNALLCLSPRGTPSHNLRRRLAATYLFDDPSIARSHPDDVITIKRLSEHLGTDVFSISNATDFTDLKARMLLLDIIIDDGCAPASAPSRNGNSRAISTGGASRGASRGISGIGGNHRGSMPTTAEAAFNKDIDDLAAKLGAMSSAINDYGMKLARTEAKAVIQWVQKRLLYSVRTRLAPQTNIYDKVQGKNAAATAAAERDAAMLPRQQELMRNYFQSLPMTDCEVGKADGK